LIAVSAEVKRDLVRYGVAPAEKIDVISLGLDLEAFLATEPRTGTFRAEIGVDASTPLVGIVGRVVPIKNHRLFLDAARHVLARNARARFVVVGDGPSRADAEAHARELGIQSQVTFAGWRRDLASIYPDLDVVVISSNNEGTPVSAIEAMAASRPVVSTRVGGVPDFIVDGETGILVPPRDPGALGAALTGLIGDRPKADGIGAAARSAVRMRFTPERLVSDIDDLYFDLVRRSRAIANSRALPIRIAAKRPVEWARIPGNP
ncbi:MAG: glycosyltransferase, partial [Candidatus Binatia bacterium]